MKVKRIGLESVKVSALGIIALSLIVFVFSSCSSDDDVVDNVPAVAYDSHAVDLGLPSGNLWSDVNYGASKATEAGGFYAWGETKTKDKYDESTYEKLTIDITNGIAKTSADVVYVNEGGKWYIPTIADWSELISEDYTTWTWEEGADYKGYRIVSKKNGNSIFLPAVGYKQGEKSVTASWNFYLSSTGDPGYATLDLILQFKKTTIGTTSTYTYFGIPIRPVRSK